MVVNPAGRCTTSASSDRPEIRVQDDDEGIRQIDVNNGFLGTSSEIDDDGPSLDEHFPEEYKMMKFSLWSVIQLASLILIIGALACSLAIPRFRNKKIV
ncbi:unnamed protein product [Camellia sinensis]